MSGDVRQPNRMDWSHHPVPIQPKLQLPTVVEVHQNVAKCVCDISFD